jgi:hypothetical protein
MARGGRGPAAFRVAPGDRAQGGRGPAECWPDGDGRDGEDNNGWSGKSGFRELGAARDAAFVMSGVESAGGSHGPAEARGTRLGKEGTARAQGTGNVQPLGRTSETDARRRVFPGRSDVCDRLLTQKVF